MALLYIDSMGDHYTAAQASTKWTSVSFQQREAGVHGYAMRGAFNKGLIFGSATVLLETYIRCHASTAGSLCTFADSTPVTHIYVNVQGDGAVKVTHWGGSLPGFVNLGLSAPDTIRIDTWYHFGIRVKIHATAGELEVRINGGPVIGPLTGLNTTDVTSTFTGLLRSFSLGGNDNTYLFDDLVVMDDVDDGLNDPRLPGGGGFDKFLGPVEVRVKRPNAAVVTGWTPTPTVPNYQNVDDVEPDDDTTYNSAASGAVGAEDLFELEDLASGEDILGAQVLVSARKTEEGTAAIKPLLRQAGVTTPQPEVFLPSTYSYAITPLAQPPNGGLWTASVFNTLQAGYRKTV